MNRHREIPPVAVEGGIFDSFFRYNFRPEVDNDVISGLAIDYVGMGVQVEFGDSRSNGPRDIRGADFVSNERTNMTKPIPIARNAFQTFRLKTAGSTTVSNGNMLTTE